MECNYFKEELEIFLWLAAIPEPQVEAMAAKRRWSYIKEQAEARLGGRPCDPSLPQVAQQADQYLRIASRRLRALDEWLGQHQATAGEVHTAMAELLTYVGRLHPADDTLKALVRKVQERVDSVLDQSRSL